MKGLILFVLLTTGTFLYADGWRSDHITIVREQKSKGLDHLILKDASGKQFEVFESSLSTEKQIQRILELKDFFYGWKSLKIKSLEFRLSRTKLNINVVPAELRMNGKDLATVIPSGILFLDRKTLEYQYRILSKKNTLKIQGKYINEMEFFQKLSQAVENPAAYVRTQDPDYYLAKLDVLEKEIDQQKLDNYRLKISMISLLNQSMIFGNIMPISKETISKIVDVKRKNPDWKLKELKEYVSQQKINIGEKEIKLIIGVFFNEVL